MSDAAWIQTRTKRQFFLERPALYAYDIHEIAEVLSRIVRFGGHAGGYSVAQHSALVAELVESSDVRVKRAALLHDAAECFFGDIVSPLRRLIGPDYKSLIAECERAIAAHFGLLVVGIPLAWRSDVKKADLVALATEKRDLCGPSPFDDQWMPLPEPDARPIGTILSPIEAEGLFLERWHSYGGTLPGRSA